MTQNYCEQGTISIDHLLQYSSTSQKEKLKTVCGQSFYAIHATNSSLNIPFPPQPHTVLFESNKPVGSDLLKIYAEKILNYGCVHVLCRGEEAEEFSNIYDQIVEEKNLHHHGYTLTSMPIDDEEPLEEAIQYFILPDDLANVGLLLVLGDGNHFDMVVKSFTKVTNKVIENYKLLVNNKELVTL